MTQHTLESDDCDYELVFEYELPDYYPLKALPDVEVGDKVKYARLGDDPTLIQWFEVESI
ncbi:MAG: hypothetical protein ABEN55_04070 [Bradymonadaceae bacterium]